VKAMPSKSGHSLFRWRLARASHLGLEPPNRSTAEWLQIDPR
jgi:hypothetical protein